MTRGVALEVRHDARTGRFYVQLDGSIAYVDYIHVDERTLDFRRTFVPPPHRGRGIGAQIVRYALRDARARGLRVIPTCSYVAALIQRDASFADVVAD